MVHGKNYGRAARTLPQIHLGSSQPSLQTLQKGISSCKSRTDVIQDTSLPSFSTKLSQQDKVHPPECGKLDTLTTFILLASILGSVRMTACLPQQQLVTMRNFYLLRKLQLNL
jgi:hypothetical protein